MNYDGNGNLLVNVAAGGSTGSGGSGTGSTSLINNGSTVGPGNPLPVATYTNGAQTSSTNPLPTSTPLAAPVTGQQKITTGGTAVALGTGALVNGVVVKAYKTNTGTIFVGPTGVNTTLAGTGNGYPLAAGESISFAVSNLSQLYINGTTGDFVAYAGN